jgi:hypothetical protein
LTYKDHKVGAILASIKKKDYSNYGVAYFFWLLASQLCKYSFHPHSTRIITIQSSNTPRVCLCSPRCQRQRPLQKQSNDRLYGLNRYYICAVLPHRQHSLRNENVSRGTERCLPKDGDSNKRIGCRNHNSLQQSLTVF